MNQFETAPEAMLKSRTRAGLTFRNRVEEVLDRAGIPEAHFGEDADGDTYCDRSGYLIAETGKRYAQVAIIGNGTLGDTARQMARDELMQQARAALDADHLTVAVSGHGHLRVVGG